MIIFVYFWMKFFLLKMNNDWEEELFVLGRLMLVVFLVKWWSELLEGF